MDKKKKLFLLMVFTLSVFILIIHDQLPSGLSTPRAYLMQLVLGNTSLHSDRDSETLMTEYIQRREALSIYSSNYANSTCQDKARGPCVDPACNATFQPPRHRLQRLLTTQYRVSDVHLDLLRSTGAQVPPADVVFVTAASENHFEESQGVIKDLHEKVFPWMESSTNYTYTFIYYDLGLSNNSLALLSKYCRCHLLGFPFQSLPAVFQSLKTYLWKPFVLKAHSPFSKLLIWMDACVRFRSGNIAHTIQRVMADGFLIQRNPFYMLPRHVMPPMLQYFQTEPCLLAPFYETEAGFIVVKNEPLINTAVMEPWIACTFAPRCVYPGDDWRTLVNCPGSKSGYSLCHRFEQAAMGVILVTLFDFKVSQIVAPDKNVVFRRDHKVKYFVELTNMTSA